MRTSATGGFDGKLQTAAAANFDAAASQQASQGRVITAVSYSSPGTICFLSYSRQNDNSTYKASVATAPTASEAIAAATNLAAAGYIITGFGGNTLNGYVIIRDGWNPCERERDAAFFAGCAVEGLLTFSRICPGGICVRCKLWREYVHF